MTREKSCGAVVFRHAPGNIEYLLVKSARRGHWGFAKGHVEPGESEWDTALREVFEETGLRIRLLEGFRSATEYPLREGAGKEVVFFLGSGAGQAVAVPEGEISDFRWLAYPDAMALLTYMNSRAVLAEAHAFLTTPPPPSSPG